MSQIRHDWCVPGTRVEWAAPEKSGLHEVESVVTRRTPRKVCTRCTWSDGIQTIGWWWLSQWTARVQAGGAVVVPGGER